MNALTYRDIASSLSQGPRDRRRCANRNHAIGDIVDTPEGWKIYCGEGKYKPYQPKVVR